MIYAQALVKHMVSVDQRAITRIFVASSEIYRPTISLAPSNQTRRYMTAHNRGFSWNPTSRKLFAPSAAAPIGTKFADRCDAALHDLGTKRRSVQANSVLDTD
jgi:hypothetical protein